MSWVLFGQILGIMLVAYLFVVTGHATITDKRREDDHRRKENGL